MSNHNGDARGLTALLDGFDCTLGRAVAVELASRGVRLVLRAAKSSPAAAQFARELQESSVAANDITPELGEGADEEVAVAKAAAVHGRLDVLVNVFVPRADTGPCDLHKYPARLLERGMHAGRLMESMGVHGAIVNHCFLPSMYAGTRLEPYMPVLKGAVTGVTRSLCRTLGRSGIRVNTVQTGFLDLPETRAIASADVLQRQTPVGRWGTASEAARFITFLALDNGYMTGQATILDGGMTAGITGT